MTLDFVSLHVRMVPESSGELALYLSAYGVRIEIRCANIETQHAARSYFPGAWEVAAVRAADRSYAIAHGLNRNLYSLYADDSLMLQSANIADLLERLEGDVRLTVADRAADRVFVHAGVVGWKGKAIIVPGRSHAGKSSLVAELVRRGATYYSDEYAVCDPRGRIHPFHKPLELRKEGERRQFKVDVEQLGGTLGTRPLRVGLVLLTSYRKSATWRPRELPAGKGVLELLAQTVSARRNPEKAFATFKHLIQDATILKGARGEAREMVQRLLTRYADW